MCVSPVATFFFGNTPSRPPEAHDAQRETARSQGMTRVLAAIRADYT